MNPEVMPPRALKIWSAVLFFGVLVLSVPQAALLPLLDRDEPRFAEASREMRQSDNFIVPTFDQRPRYAKPPLIYWTQVASYEFFGENAFSARLPSLIATAGTAVLLFLWGCELGGSSIGFIAAVGYAFCLQTVQQGRVATADGLLIFFTTLTAWAGFNLRAIVRKNSGQSWNFWGVLFTLGLAGGFLAKGPEAFLPALVALWMMRGEGARVVGALLAMALLALLIIAGWAIPAYVQSGGAYWREGLEHDVGDRMVTGFQGHGSSAAGWYLLGLPLYLLTFWLSAFPWSPLLLIWRKRLFSDWRPEEADLYLLLNAAAFFAVFSLMVTKLPHYTLPAFPLLGLIFARRWVARALSLKIPLGLSIGFATILAVLFLLLAPVLMIRGFDPSPVGELVRDAGNALNPATEFAVVDFREPSAVWEMRRIVRGSSRIIATEGVLPFLQQPGSRAVLLTGASWDRVRPSAGAGVSSLKIFSARGWNAAKGTSLDLRLVVNGR